VSEYLSEEEQVAKMKSWWDENGTALITGVVAAVAALFGWNWYGNYQQDQTYAASEAYVAYVETDGADKADAAARLASEYSQSNYRYLVLLNEARLAQDNGDLATAESQLEEVVASGASSLLVDLAKIRLAKIQQAQDRSTQALATLATIENEGYRAWGLEAKGDIHVALGQIELAYEAYTAASESLGAETQRPILAMKLKNVTPVDGNFVPLTDTLTQALDAAKATLEEGITTDSADNENSNDSRGISNDE